MFAFVRISRTGKYKGWSMKHILTLPLGFMDEEGSGKVRKVVNESSAATETYLAHRLPRIDAWQLLRRLVLRFFFSYLTGGLDSCV